MWWVAMPACNAPDRFLRQIRRCNETSMQALRGRLVRSGATSEVHVAGTPGLSEKPVETRCKAVHPGFVRLDYTQHSATKNSDG
jgi:hypothetical protein